MATMVYPGGSLSDKDSIGFDWSKNFISNLFGAKAVNGSDNPSRIWADAGMIFLSVSFAVFFMAFSKKIRQERCQCHKVFWRGRHVVYCFNSDAFA